MIIADEVYSDNVYEKGAKFHSFRKILAKQKKEIANSVELFSMNSISKGVTGECGLRGGYLEAVNIDPEVQELMLKCKSIELCANTVGQISMTLKVDPPKRGQESDETVE
jgi:aspartate/methionine/tyrosine aminotransferase